MGAATGFVISKVIADYRATHQLPEVAAIAEARRSATTVLARSPGVYSHVYTHPIHGTTIDIGPCVVPGLCDTPIPSGDVRVFRNDETRQWLIDQGPNTLQVILPFDALVNGGHS